MIVCCFRIVCLSAIIGVPASAATITFNPASGYFSDLSRNAPQTQASGIWNEAGFAVSWVYGDDRVAEDYGDAKGSLGNGAYVFDCVQGGCAGGLLSLAVTRSDGRLFTLDRVNIETAQSGYLTEVLFYGDELGDGEIYAPIADTIMTSWNNVSLNGTGFSGFDGPLTPVGSAFKDIAKLSVTVGGGPSEADLASPANRARIDRVLNDYAQTCDTACAGLTPADLTYYFEYGFFANFGSAVRFGAFEFTLAEPEIAPVPLPAGLPLGVSGLAVLAAIRVRRNRPVRGSLGSAEL